MLTVKLEKFVNGNAQVVETRPASSLEDATAMLRIFAAREDLNSDYAGYVFEDGKIIRILNIFEGAAEPKGGVWSIVDVSWTLIDSSPTYKKRG